MKIVLTQQLALNYTSQIFQKSFRIWFFPLKFIGYVRQLITPWILEIYDIFVQCGVEVCLVINLPFDSPNGDYISGTQEGERRRTRFCRVQIIF